MENTIFLQNKIAFCDRYVCVLLLSIFHFLCFKIRNFRSDCNVLSLIHCCLDSIKVKFIAYEKALLRNEREKEAIIVCCCCYYGPFCISALWSFVQIKSSKKRFDWIDGKGKNAFYNAMAKVIIHD